MSYSDTCALIEKQGYEHAFKTIYNDYRVAKKKCEELEEQLRRATIERDGYMNAASHFMKRAANENNTIVEDGSHVVRMLVGEEVVHFRVPHDADTIFIGYWPLSQIKEQL